MSAFPTSLENELLGDGPSEVPKLAPRAAGYFILIGLATAASAFRPWRTCARRPRGWTTFAILGIIAATAQLFVVRMPSRTSRTTRRSSS